MHADPFSMTPVNQASQTSGSTLSWPSQKNPEPKSVLQDFSTFQPLDVTRSSRQAQVNSKVIFLFPIRKLEVQIRSQNKTGAICYLGFTKEFVGTILLSSQ